MQLLHCFKALDIAATVLLCLCGAVHAQGAAQNRAAKVNGWQAAPAADAGPCHAAAQNGLHLLLNCAGWPCLALSWGFSCLLVWECVMCLA